MEKNSFIDYKISEEIQQALTVLGYETPTKVQKQVLDSIKERKDLVVQAKTGSGKTAAFGIPICEEIDWLKNKPQALILVPTRELAIQVADEIRQIGRLKRLKVIDIFGRVSMEKQEQSLKQKTHIVVGTPGRVFDLIERGSLCVDEIQTAVIDEADEMFFIGLREQVERILKKLPTKRKTYLFSATLKEEIKELAKAYMDEFLEIKSDEKELTVEKIRQIAYVVSPREKFHALKYVLINENPDSSMIFVNTQVEADQLTEQMKRCNIPCSSLHGGMKQIDRMKVMDAFKKGKFRFLITSDVAARGIDIDKISLVINYDMPRGNENYVHRIGRTGRIGNEGMAVTFAMPKEQNKLKEIMDYTKHSFDVIKGSPEEPDEKKEQEFFNKLGQTIVLKEQKSERFQDSILKLEINAGKKGKIRPVDIVGTICSIDGITAEDIGVIEIRDIKTTVEILNQKGGLVLKGLKDKTIKGKKRKVYKARRD